MNIKSARKAKGLTQQQVADYVGISQNNYSYWERGKVKIDNFSLKKLSELFGVSIDYLLGKDTASSVDNEIKRRPNYELSEKFANEYADLLKDENFIETVKLYNAITVEQRAVCVGCIATILERLGVPVAKILNY